MSCFSFIKKGDLVDCSIRVHAVGKLTMLKVLEDFKLYACYVDCETSPNAVDCDVYTFMENTPCPEGGNWEVCLVTDEDPLYSLHINALLPPETLSMFLLACSLLKKYIPGYEGELEPVQMVLDSDFLGC
jgi:hypothetical protein